MRRHLSLVVVMHVDRVGAICKMEGRSARQARGSLGRSRAGASRMSAQGAAPRSARRVQGAWAGSHPPIIVSS